MKTLKATMTNPFLIAAQGFAVGVLLFYAKALPVIA